MREPIICLTYLRFVALFCQTSLEAIVPPVMQTYFNYEDQGNAVLYSLAGLELILVFIVLKLSSRWLSDRSGAHILQQDNLRFLEIRRFEPKFKKMNLSYYFSSEFSTNYSPLGKDPDRWRPPPHALRHDLADRHDAEVRARRPVQPPLLRSGRHPGSGGNTHCVRHWSVALQQAASFQYAGTSVTAVIQPVTADSKLLPSSMQVARLA